ncbi:MAG: efflux RND transporter periplasmic adaptor subunit [Nitrospira sp. LK70]|nr:efflux RND transporter periplasmic adaptor subunit [Nitrospira sp.]NGZ11645.1 efflux RND transporter periplasmic adaptor subunit [Nitrospira sp. LK70]
MNKMPAKTFATLGVLLCVMYFSYRYYSAETNAAVLRETTLDHSIQKVSVITPKMLPPNETITLPGNIQAWYEAQIFAQVSGYVKMWHKDYGAIVKKDDVLAEINAPALDAQYAQAKADLETERARYVLAELTAKRYVALRPNQAVSEQSISVQVQEAKAQAAKVRAAEQNVRNFEALIRFKTIVAPFDGVVTARNINVGNYVNKEATPGEGGSSAIRDLFTVADVGKLRLFVSVPETFGPFLQPGLTADVTVPQLPNRHFTGKFLTVARGFDVGTRTAITVFEIDNADRALWPGSYATVRLTAPVEKNILTIPTTALVFQEHGAQIALVSADDRVHFKPITMNRVLDNVMEITEGITESDRIINNPSAALLEGDKVRIVTPTVGYDLVTGEKPAPEATAPKHEPSAKPL